MTKPKSASKPIAVEAERDETQSQTMARILTAPYWRHGFVLKALSDKSVGKIEGEPQFDDFGWAIKRKAEQASTGDLVLAIKCSRLRRTHSMPCSPRWLGGPPQTWVNTSVRWRPTLDWH